MSKTTSKQKYVQLMEWLSVFKKGDNSSKKTRKFSKADYYKKTRERYGRKKSN